MPLFPRKKKKDSTPTPRGIGHGDMVRHRAERAEGGRGSRLGCGWLVWLGLVLIPFCFVFVNLVRCDVCHIEMLGLGLTCWVGVAIVVFVKETTEKVG